MQTIKLKLRDVKKPGILKSGLKSESYWHLYSCMLAAWVGGALPMEGVVHTAACRCSIHSGIWF